MPGQVLLAGEGHAEIDGDPRAAGARRRSRRSTRFMPISPTPPSGAKTSSSLRAQRIAQRSPKREDVAGGDRCRPLPSARSQHQTARRRRGSRSGPTSSRSASAHAEVSPRPAARASQSARMAAKPCPPFHCASRRTMARRRAPGTKPRARPARPGRQDRSPDSRCLSGWCGAIDADADRRRRMSARFRPRSECRRPSLLDRADRSAI